jgi:hypothetical protein
VPFNQRYYPMGSGTVHRAHRILCRILFERRTQRGRFHGNLNASGALPERGSHSFKRQGDAQKFFSRQLHSRFSASKFPIAPARLCAHPPPRVSCPVLFSVYSPRCCLRVDLSDGGPGFFKRRGPKEGAILKSTVASPNALKGQIFTIWNHQNTER